jgi:RNA 2',3'-cyclic 3'-phosphodiesterase
VRGVRAFVALELPSEPIGLAGRSAPEHLTLLFLGEVPSEAIARISERLLPIGLSVAPFEFRLEGIGAFPTVTEPRVVWVGVGSGREELTDLARRIRSALEGEVRIPREPFVPHLTLFRVRSPADRSRAREVLEHRVPLPAPRTIRVHEFVLKESVLGRGGATHRTIEAIPLAGPSP